MRTGRAPGYFITFEGGEGAGKSTQIGLLAERLRGDGHEVVVTREPGGSAGAEAVRHSILSGAAEPFGVRMEAILFAAARNDHVEELIRPAVAAGRIVLCDRFIDSTRVYQGATGNLDPRFLDALERASVDGMVPQLTILLDVPAELGLRRARSRGQAGSVPDRFEREDLAIHESRRSAFLDLAEREPERFRVVDGARLADGVAAAISTEVLALIGRPKRKARKARRKS